MKVCNRWSAKGGSSIILNCGGMEKTTASPIKLMQRVLAQQVQLLVLVLPCKMYQMVLQA